MTRVRCASERAVPVLQVGGLPGVRNGVARWLLVAGFAFAVIGCVPEAQAVTSRQLVEVVDIANLAASPDGRYVAFRTEQASIERNTYDTVWYVQRMDGSAAPRRLADGGVPLRGSAGSVQPAPPVWSPDGRWLYYRALVDGRVDVWRAAADGSDARPVTVDPADTREFSLSPDGGFLYYSVGVPRSVVQQAEIDEYRSGIRLDEHVPIGGQGLFRTGHVEGRPATQRFTGTWFDRAGLLSHEPVRWRKLGLASGAVQDVAAHDVPAHRPTSSAGADDALAAFMSERQPGNGRVARLTRVDADPHLVFGRSVELSVVTEGRMPRKVVCEADPCTGNDILGIAWRPGTDEVLFTISDQDEGRAQTIHRWDVASGAVAPVVRSFGLVNGGRSPGSACAVSYEALACVAAEAGSPPRLERIDLVSGERRVLFDPNAALAQDLRRAVHVERLSWRDASGQAYSGQFFRRAGVRDVPQPLFVTYYSCSGFLRGGVGDEWPLAAMASHGISTLCINYAPLRNDAVERFDQGLAAVDSAVELLAARGDVDPSKVGMGGLSFGSEIALWVAMRSDLLAAVSVASPVVSPSYYLLGSLKGDEFLTGLRELWDLGAPDDTPERWGVLSPAFNLDRITSPVLMQLPEQEYIQSLDYAIPLMQRRQADVYVFPDEPHQKFQPRHKLAAYERNLDWFRYWLQGFESEQPHKLAQYGHWRGLQPRQAGAIRRP